MIALVLLGLGGCKKAGTYEECFSECEAKSNEELERCLSEKGPGDRFCGSVRTLGFEACRQRCDKMFGQPEAGSAEPASTASAEPKLDVPGTEADARALLEQFVAAQTDHATLSRALRPSSADYRVLYKEAAAAELEKALTPAWESGQLVVAPSPGQTEVKLWSATAADLRAQRGAAVDHFPGGYAEVAIHLNDGVTLYSFKFVEPGQALGMAYDGLAHVNGRWIIIPKPWRALRNLRPTEEPEALDDAPTEGAVTTKEAPAADPSQRQENAKSAATSLAPGNAPVGNVYTVRSGQLTVNGSLDIEIILRVVMKRKHGFMHCINQGLDTNPSLKGRVTTKFVIGTTGKVTSAGDNGSTIDSPAVISCVVKLFSSLEFPQPQGGSATVIFPLDFEGPISLHNDPATISGLMLEWRSL